MVLFLFNPFSIFAPYIARQFLPTCFINNLNFINNFNCNLVRNLGTWKWNGRRHFTNLVRLNRGKLFKFYFKFILNSQRLTQIIDSTFIGENFWEIEDKGNEKLFLEHLHLVYVYDTERINRTNCWRCLTKRHWRKIMWNSVLEFCPTHENTSHFISIGERKLS